MKEIQRKAERDRARVDVEKKKNFEQAEEIKRLNDLLIKKDKDVIYFRILIQDIDIECNLTHLDGQNPNGDAKIRRRSERTK